MAIGTEEAEDPSQMEPNYLIPPSVPDSVSHVFVNKPAPEVRPGEVPTANLTPRESTAQKIFYNTMSHKQSQQLRASPSEPASMVGELHATNKGMFVCRSFEQIDSVYDKKHQADLSDMVNKSSNNILGSGK